MCNPMACFIFYSLAYDIAGMLYLWYNYPTIYYGCEIHRDGGCRIATNEKMIFENGLKKAKLLIVDDSHINRMILEDILGDKYEFVEASNGREAIAAIKHSNNTIDLVLLDLIMPVMNGFEVLEYMKKKGWLDYLPVIVVSAEGDSKYMEMAYELGAVEFIKHPYDASIIHRRIENILTLYQKQRRLVKIVEQQIYENESYSRQMIDILGHIVEFRNGESNLHVHHVQLLTRILLANLLEMTDEYNLSEKDIMLISNASALHDIGKISIDEKILNKPGKLTQEEFEIVKTHSAIGAQMIEKLPVYDGNNKDNILYYCYQICRWHHERWDGKGYPDSLKGDKIPISAQIVALADVYDALTSERCYKTAFSHNTAINMICNGECGAFNPLLIRCLQECSNYIKAAIHGNSNEIGEENMILKITRETLSDKLNDYSNKDIYLAEQEGKKRQFFIEGIKELQLEYDSEKRTLTMSSYAADFLGSDSLVIDIDDAQPLLAVDNIDKFKKIIMQTSPKNTYADTNMHLVNGGKKYLCDVKMMSLWSDDINPKFLGCAIRIIPNNDFEAVNSLVINDTDVEDLADFTNQMNKVFDVVRVVDPEVTSVVSADEYEQATENSKKSEKLKCYEFWGKGKRCQNCTSYKALKTKEIQSKLEFVGDSVYQIFSKYIKLNGKELVVEMVYKNKEDMLLDATGKNDLVDYVKSYNRRLYRDSLTGAYNRRYFDEVAKHMGNIGGVVMMDIDRFKFINDKFGHIAGDVAIKSVVASISKVIRKNDKLIRYGGDELVLIVGKISCGEFEKTLRNIVEVVKNTKVDNQPDLKLSVTVGGVYGINDVESAVEEADKLMYQGKNKEKHIVSDKTQNK